MQRKTVRLKKCKNIDYIISLKIRNVPIFQTTLKTGFLEFIIDLQNVVVLVEELLTENVAHFLLIYKLLQDDLETFFFLIRRMNGWNNNPTAKQFKHSFRKIYLANISVFL